MAHKWKQTGESVYELYLKNFPCEDDEPIATLSCNPETDLWQLESYVEGFNTYFLNEKNRDVKSLAEDFISQQCDSMCKYYEEIQAKLET